MEVALHIYHSHAYRSSVQYVLEQTGSSPRLVILDDAEDDYSYVTMY